MSLLNLQQSIVYGPVHSRRLGISLGINLLPRDVKVCTFNCLYCQYGWTPLTKTAILSNSTTLEQSNIRNALNKLDVRIMKLDAGISKMLHQFNKPHAGISLKGILEGLKQQKLSELKINACVF